MKNFSIEPFPYCSIFESKHPSNNSSPEHYENQEEIIFDKMARIDKSLSDSWKIYICFFVHSLDLRDNKGHNNCNHRDSDKYDSHRIDESGFNFSFEVCFTFFFRSDNLEGFSYLSCRISHLKDGDIEHTKDFWEFRGNTEKGFSCFDWFREMFCERSYFRGFCLKKDNLKRFHNGNSRIQKCPEIFDENQFIFSTEWKRWRHDFEITKYFTALIVPYSIKICKKSRKM